jgi:hypothetical protein
MQSERFISKITFTLAMASFVFIGWTKEDSSSAVDINDQALSSSSITDSYDGRAVQRNLSGGGSLNRFQ